MAVGEAGVDRGCTGGVEGSPSHAPISADLVQTVAITMVTCGPGHAGVCDPLIIRAFSAAS